MSIPEKAVKLNELERKIYNDCCAAGREAFKAVLEAYDSELRRSRDFKAYRHKGTRKTVMKTVMGEVEFRRAVYETRDSEGRKGFVYLLDEALGRTGSGFFSGLLSEEIVRSVCESTYRGGARAVSEMTGQSISHTAAWKVVQQVGAGVDALEQRAAAQAVKQEGIGKLETKVLFEEQDGIWLKLQGKDRKRYGASREMKLAIAYDGAKKTGKKRYELTNKVACANFEGAGKFQRRKEGVIAGTYNVDEIQIRLLNGDGAAWIKGAVTDENVHFQLDPFHRNKAVRSFVRDEEMRAEMMELLYAKKIDALLAYVEACSNSVEDEDERQNLLSLLTYFTANKEGLVPCHRRGLNLPESPDGKEYRRMGTMESNIFTILGNRMKGRRACWSVKGGNNLARLLCLKSTGFLSDTLQNLTGRALPEKYAEEVTVKMTSTNAPKWDGKGYEPCRAGAFPAVSDWKWLREITRTSPLLS